MNFLLPFKSCSPFSISRHVTIVFHVSSVGFWRFPSVSTNHTWTIANLVRKREFRHFYRSFRQVIRPWFQFRVSEMFLLARQPKTTGGKVFCLVWSEIDGLNKNNSTIWPEIPTKAPPETLQNFTAEKWFFRHTQSQARKVHSRDSLSSDFPQIFTQVENNYFENGAMTGIAWTLNFLPSRTNAKLVQSINSHWR